MKNVQKKLYPIVTAFLLIFIDQAVKFLAAEHLKGKSDYPLISGILLFSNKGVFASYYQRRNRKPD